MTSHPDVEIIDVTDSATFDRLPPCADARFDHRSCDYWEDEVRGSKTARPSWWQEGAPAPRPRPAGRPSNPFAPARGELAFNPFSPSSEALEGPAFNPFAPARQDENEAATSGVLPKMRLLDRGRGVFGSYAKILLASGEPAVYAQFGPLSAYPRAQHIRELYPTLPASPLPAVITCIASTSSARGQGLARRLIAAVVDDLAARGFSAVETYPDLSLTAGESSSADPAFWEACGFQVAAPDERFPVLRRVL